MENKQFEIYNAQTNKKKVTIDGKQQFNTRNKKKLLQREEKKTVRELIIIGKIHKLINFNKILKKYTKIS